MSDTVTIEVPAKLARTLLVFEKVIKEKRSGQLRVNFSQGTPTENLQWLEGLSNGRPCLSEVLDKQG
jgi:hypothetical protein